MKAIRPESSDFRLAGIQNRGPYEVHNAEMSMLKVWCQIGINCLPAEKRAVKANASPDVPLLPLA